MCVGFVYNMKTNGTDFGFVKALAYSSNHTNMVNLCNYLDAFKCLNVASEIKFCVK